MDSIVKPLKIKWEVIFCLFLLSALLGCEGQQQNGTALAYEDSAFGVLDAFTASEYSYFKERMGFTNEDYWTWAEGHMKNLGAHWTRGNQQLIWDIIEPEIGKGYNWDNQYLTDSMIKRIYSHGNSVHWLGAFTEGLRSEVSLRNPLDYPDEYKAFVKAAVERYDGDGIDDAAPAVRVKYWQIGNESPFWQEKGRTAQDYIKFVKMISEAVKEADPEAKIVLIAPTDGLSVDTFLIEVIDSLATQDAFDVIDIHHWGTAEEWKMSAISQYRQILDSKGLANVQIWSTENGTWQGQPPQLPLAQTEEDQARFLIKRYVYNLNNGLNKLFWNNLLEWYHYNEDTGSIFNSMGLITDGQGAGEDPSRFNTERVAYWAYKLLASRIDTHISNPLGKINEIYRQGEVYGYAYQRKDNGKNLYILWSEIGEQNVTFKVDGTVQVTDMITDRYGNILKRQSISSLNGRVTITIFSDPVLVEEVEAG
ncbi:MAG: hypothetical protein HZA06_02445 [Nitrospirae bacterium]|nr:hypothetical protein [Nitrospirota bacterium]